MESKIVKVPEKMEELVLTQVQAFGWVLRGVERIAGADTAVKVESKIQESTLTTSQLIKGAATVRLHFTRSLTLPHLERLMELEAEASKLPFPDYTQTVDPNLGGLLVLFGLGGLILGGIALVVDPAEAGAVYIPATGLGSAALSALVGWSISVKQANERRKIEYEKSMVALQALIAEARPLLLNRAPASARVL